MPADPRLIHVPAWLRLLHWYRRPCVIALHVLLVAASNQAAFLLRFDAAVTPDATVLFWAMLPWLLLIRGVVFIPFRLYGGLWRYTGIWDLRNIIGGVVTSSAIFYLLVHWGFGLTGYPRAVFVIDAVLLIFAMGGVRLARRIYRELGHLDREKRVLIYGAGDAGEMIVRDMLNNPFYDYEPVGFVDDDRGKVGQRIHGVRVLGTREDLARIFAAEEPHEVLVAMPKAEPRTIRRVVQALEPFKIPITTLPSLRDLLGGKVAVSQIRHLSIEDLLAREPVGLDSMPVRHLIAGRRVLVTGAGGSIGSELCRQIIAFRPAALVLFERYENGLYEIAKDLLDRDGGLCVWPVIGDVTDTGRVEAVLAEHAPEIIFHAAAHKHVPLMELNPCEAVKNNIRGTRVLAESAQRHRVDRFIQISSDKAVNPTSVMGATKRVGELILQMMVEQPTRFVVVRFGNVLGSSGSVVPRFLEQIKAGGPVTVTHPEVRRYFMLIPEAVQLVLHAATLGRAGAVYVLEMGEQLKVLDVARNLIRLSGFVPDEEIPIRFIGLRPGEKLSEELVGADETVELPVVDKILHVRAGGLPDPGAFALEVAKVEELAAQGDTKGVAQSLRELVPTYRPAANGGDEPETEIHQPSRGA